MKNKLKVITLLSLFLLLLFGGQSRSFAEDTDKKQLLYDLKYDKDKSVLSGKSQPNANIFINDLAGSIVADDEGNFEVPIPKEFKTSTVRMLDAIGEESTDVTFDFEKNTVVTEETSAASKTDQSSQTDETTSSKKEASDKAGTTNKDEATSSQATDSSTKNDSSSDSKKQSSGITSDSFVSETKEPVKSKAWLWTLLVILGVFGLATGFYFWYKNKIEKEENRKRTKKRKHSKKKSKNHTLEDEEDELYASILNDTQTKSNSKKGKQMDLDELIDSELKKNATSSKSKKSSSRKKVSTKKKNKK